MTDRDHPRQPTHRVYTVIRRASQDDYWLNLGLAFAHKDGNGFNIILHALPIDGKIVCREISEDDRTRDRSSSTGQRGAGSAAAPRKAEPPRRT